VKRFCCVMVLVASVVVYAQDGDMQKKPPAPYGHPTADRSLFDSVYPAFARQLVQDYGVTKGIAVDLGGANGSLAFELAKIADLKVYNVDINPTAVRQCGQLAEQNKLVGRVIALEADAANLPLRDNLADLVVSRNSLFQWKDKIAGFREAYRILKPGGVACMGGGFSRLLAADALKQMVAWSEEKVRQRPDSFVEMPHDIPEQLRAFGITHARIIEGPSRFDWWLEMRKPLDAGDGNRNPR
jgi:SAM-dependent methyltransferase